MPPLIPLLMLFLQLLTSLRVAKRQENDLPRSNPFGTRRRDGSYPLYQDSTNTRDASHVTGEKAI